MIYPPTRNKRTPRGAVLMISALGLIALASGVWAGCDSIDQAGGGLTRAEYAKRLDALCRVDVRNEGLYSERFDSAGERYDTDPDYSYADYWDDVATLEEERLDNFSRFVKRVEAVEAPFTFEEDEEPYLRYLRRQVVLLREIEAAAGRSRDAARVDQNDDSWLPAYDGANERFKAFSDRGFESDASFVDFLLEETGCLEAV